MDIEAKKLAIEENRPIVFRYALRRLGNWHDAEDVAQNVCLVALTKDCRDADRFDAWFYRIAINKTFDQMRSNNRKNRRFEQETQKDGDELSDMPVGWTGPTQESNLIRRECRELVNQAIGKLPETEQAVVRMRYLYDSSTSEISEHLHIKDGTVGSHLNRAHEKLSRSNIIKDLSAAMGFRLAHAPAAPLVPARPEQGCRASRDGVTVLAA